MCQLWLHLRANFVELRQREVRRISLPRTPVNKRKEKGQGVEEPSPFVWQACAYRRPARRERGLRGLRPSPSILHLSISAL
jgi:hypothetical protein